MTFASVDSSVDTGQVYYTCNFNFQNANYYFSNRPTNITIGTITYSPGLLDFQGLTEDIVLRSLPSMTVTLDRDNTIFDVFADNFIASTMTLQIQRRYVGETEFRTIFNGYVESFDIERAVISLTCRTILSRLENNFVHEPISAMCRFTLYGNDCGVAQNSFRTNISSFTVLNNVVTVPSGVLNTTAHYYRYGLFVCNNIYREVFGSSSTTLTLGRSFVQGSATTAVVYAGCDHQRVTCQNKFNNRARFGGFPGKPANRNIGKI